ncbi:MAG: tol-pal system-associated acyl-CoA thioesterase [Arenicella sp.]|nr:tol-pal system-associated acyl-CoA thioesterase [Arenicella sp.]
MFEKAIRVYYEDTDAGGVVYHSNYLNFMERCRCDWLDSLGHNIANIHDNTGIIFVVREATLKYDLPARLFDQLTVTVRPLQVGKVKLLLEQKIYNQEQLICQATIKLATLHHSSFKLSAMPDSLRVALAADV